MRIDLEIPEHLLATTEGSELAQRIKLYAAILMFQSRELSAGAASELAGMGRADFLDACRKYGVPAINYPPPELKQELELLQRDSAC